LALVWKQRRAFHSSYVPLRHSCYPGGPSPCTSHYEISFGYYAASVVHNVRWHFRACKPRLVSRCRDNLGDFPSSEARDDRTFSCLLHAGWSWGQRGLGGETLTPATLPFWSRCMSHFHLLVLTTLTRRFLSSAWVQGWSVNRFVASSAELLSAGSIPRCLPSIDACCVALMPLSWHNSFEGNHLLR